MSNKADVKGTPKRRGSAPIHTRSRSASAKRTQTPIRKKSVSKPAMDKESMLVMEANEISTLLGKDYVFVKLSDEDGEDCRIKVRNTKYCTYCVWPLSKFKERLVRMRKLMYAGDSESSALDGESVFFDPNDTWSKETDADEVSSSTPITDVPVVLEDYPAPILRPKSEASTGTGTTHAPQMGVELKAGILNITAAPRPVKIPPHAKPTAWTNETSFDDKRSSLSRSHDYEQSRDAKLQLGQSENSAFHRPTSASRTSSSMGESKSSLKTNGFSGTNTDGGELPAESEFVHVGTPKVPIDMKALTQDNNKTNSISGTFQEITRNVGYNADDQPIRRAYNADDQPIRSSYADNQQRKANESHKNQSDNLPDTPKQKTYSSSHKSDKSVKSSHKDKHRKIKEDENGAGISRNSDNGKETICSRCQNLIGTKESSEKAVLPKASGVSMISLCKGAVQQTAERLKGRTKMSDNLVDKVLTNCESLKVAVITILEGYTQAQETSTTAQFIDSDQVHTLSMQLVTSLELLVSHTSLWAANLHQMESPLVSGLAKNICRHAKELSVDLLHFLQGCEEDVETEVQDSASKIIDHIYEIVQLSGELSISSEILPECLRDPDRESFADLISLSYKEDEDLMNIKPSPDLKQSFLAGTDSFVTQMYESVLRSIEEAETQMKKLVESCRISLQSNEENSKHVYIVVATVKNLLLKCQDIQTELDCVMKNDDTKPKHYFHRFFERCQAIVPHTNQLANNITLLSQAASSLDQEENHGVLRKICRCAEMVRKAASKLTAANIAEQSVPLSPNVSQSLSSLSSMNGYSLDFKTRSISVHSDSILNSKQMEWMNSASADVDCATQALVEHVRKIVPSDANSSGKVKRMLPIPPGQGSASANNGRKILRCQSAKARIYRNVSMMDVYASSSMD